VISVISKLTARTGGKESTESFKIIATVISKALESTKVPNDSIQLVTTRDAVDPLLQLSQYIDLVIPRGSNELVRHCQRMAHMPVLGHADGLCHYYIHPDAEPEMAASVIVDSKTDYPAACNSLESLLVNEDYSTRCGISSACQGCIVALRSHIEGLTI
jgi:glutamate-5-semialdehyde dehydrogenase